MEHACTYIKAVVSMILYPCMEVNDIMQSHRTDIIIEASLSMQVPQWVASGYLHLSVCKIFLFSHIMTKQ